MIHSVRFTCVLDANVIYPIEIRDLLFGLPTMNYLLPNGVVLFFVNWKMSWEEKVYLKKKL